MYLHRKKAQATSLSPSGQLIAVVILILALMILLMVAIRGQLSEILVSMFK